MLHGYRVILVQKIKVQRSLLNLYLFYFLQNVFCLMSLDREKNKLSDGTYYNKMAIVVVL